MNLFAQIISIISNPLILVAPISYALVLKSSSDAYYAIIWTFISLLFAFVIGLFIFWGVKRGIFTNMDISIRSQRSPAFIFIGLVVVMYFLLVFIVGGPIILLVTLGALLLGVVITLFINTKTKASMHLAAYSSFALIIAIIFGGLFWILPFLAPIVAWSRIKLKRHKPSETIVGAIIGISLVIILIIIVEYLLLW